MTSWLQENMTIVCLGHPRRQTKRQRVTSHLRYHRHKVCGGGLVVQSLTGFHSQDTVVPIDGKLGKRWALIVCEATQLATFGVTVNIQTKSSLFQTCCLSVVTLDLPYFNHFSHTSISAVFVSQLTHEQLLCCQLLAWTKPKPLLSLQCLAQM